jgi:hypothetical protein
METRSSIPINVYWLKNLLRFTVALSLFVSLTDMAIADGKCTGVNCDAAQKICYATLDLDPISCGIYYGCCYGQPSDQPDLPHGDSECRNDPCGPGCPSDLCILSGQLQQALTGQAQITTNVAPGACAAGVLSVLVAKGADGAVSYSWWNLGQGGHGWQQLDPTVRTNVAPAAALVGRYLWVVVRGTDGYLYLNQGTVNKPFVGWNRMNFQTDAAPGIASSGKTTVVVARDRSGRLMYNTWDLGQGGGGWTEIAADVPTVSTAAPALVGGYLFVVARGTDGNLYLNQGGLNKKFVGWRPMNFRSPAPTGATSAGTTTAVVARDTEGRVSYNWWNLGEGAKGWTALGPEVRTDVAPAASLVGDYLFVAAVTRDGLIHLNQGTLGKPFVGWK